MNFDSISAIGHKGCPKSERKKIRQKGNSFHGHFQNDFSIKNTTYTEKSQIVPAKTVPFYFSEKLKN